MPDRVVVGVPTAFNQRQRQATVEALKLAGFRYGICIDEPHAVVWAGLQEDLAGDRRIVAVYDLGGGTFDMAVCEVFGGGTAVIGSGGDEYLGGDDIDWQCAEWAVEETLRRHGWNLKTNKETMTRLVTACEEAKIALSSNEKAEIDLGAIEEAQVLEGQTLELDRARLEHLCTDLVRRTFIVCDNVLADAKVKVDAIDAVLLAGGSSQLPFIQEAVAKYFDTEIITSPAPHLLVATGAAMIAQKSNLS